MQLREEFEPKSKPRARTPRGSRVRRIRVGDKVLVAFGPSKVKAIVIEDRGNLGAGGRQIVAVKMPPASQWEEPRIYEIPAEEVKLTK